jgi:hypothetical protein
VGELLDGPIAVKSMEAGASEVLVTRTGITYGFGTSPLTSFAFEVGGLGANPITSLGWPVEGSSNTGSQYYGLGYILYGWPYIWKKA